MAGKKRCNGEGSIDKKIVKMTNVKGEEYELEYFVARIMVNGERFSKTHKLQRVVSAWLLDKRNEANRGIQLDKSKMKFKDFATIWLADKTMEGKAHTTLTAWKLYLDRHILPSLGNVILKDLTTTMINKFYADKLGTNSKKKQGGITGESTLISPNTVIHFHRIICNILNHAVRQMIIGHNPSMACSKPKAVKPTIEILTVDEVMKVLEIAKMHNVKLDGTVKQNMNPSYYPALLVDVYTGLRRSELMGLKWKYVNLDDGILTIAETLLQSTDNKIYQNQGTKSDAGTRTIDIPPHVAEVLRKHKEYVGDTEYVFCNCAGDRPDPHNFYRFFKRLLEKAGVTKNIRLHDIRHGNVSMLAMMGMNVNDISSRIGHSNTSFTMDTYAHVFATTDRQASNKLSELLYKPIENVAPMLNQLS